MRNPSKKFQYLPSWLQSVPQTADQYPAPRSGQAVPRLNPSPGAQEVAGATPQPPGPPANCSFLQLRTAAAAPAPAVLRRLSCRPRPTALGRTGQEAGGRGELQADYNCRCSCKCLLALDESCPRCKKSKSLSQRAPVLIISRCANFFKNLHTLSPRLCVFFACFCTFWGIL